MWTHCRAPELSLSLWTLALLAYLNSQLLTQGDCWLRLDVPGLHCSLGVSPGRLPGNYRAHLLFPFTKGSNIWDLLFHMFFIYFVISLSCLRQEGKSSFYCSINLASVAPSWLKVCILKYYFYSHFKDEQVEWQSG